MSSDPWLGHSTLDDTWYITCKNTTPQYHRCSQDNGSAVFLEDSQSCISCPIGEKIPDLPTCNKFTECVSDMTGLLISRFEFTCPEDKFFSTEKNFCIRNDGTYKCYMPGIFADPTDCQRYQICTWDEAESIPICCAKDEIFKPYVGCIPNDGSINCEVNETCILNQDIQKCHHSSL